MNCPTCDAPMTVRDSRKYYDPNEGFNYVQRQRYCTACNAIHASIEVLFSVWSTKLGDINETKEA